MNKIHKWIIIIIASFIFSLLACKTPRKVIKTAHETNLSPTLFLFDKIDSTNLCFKWLSAKLSVKTIINEDATHFNANLKMRKDSAIWLSISPMLGIEVARVLVTPDTVKVIDRFNKKYFVGQITEVQQKLNLNFNLNFEHLQFLITGNNFIKANKALFTSSTKMGNFYLLNLAKKELRKILNQKEVSDSTVHALTISPRNYKIIKYLTIDSEKEIQSTIDLEDYKQIDQQWFAYKKEVNTTYKNNKYYIQLIFNKLEIDVPQKMPFSIPPSYEPME